MSFAIKNAKRETCSTYLFFLWFLGVICTRVFLQFRFIAIFSILMLLYNIYLCPPKNINKCSCLYIAFLGYETILTLIYSSDGLLDLVNIFVIVCTVWSSSWLIDFNKFFKLVRNFGLFIYFTAVLETFAKRNVFYWLYSDRNNDYLGIDFWGTSSYRVSICFGHPIIAAVVLLIIFCIGICLPFSSKILQFIFISTSVVALYGTQSRSSWIVFILVLVLYETDKVRVNKMVILKICIYSICAIVLCFIFKDFFSIIFDEIYNRFSIVLDDRYENMSRMVRLKNFDNVILYVKNNLFYAIVGRGVGYAKQFTFEYVGFNGWTGCLDNQYLTFILEAGFLGLSLIIAILMYFVINFYKTKNNTMKIAMLTGIANLATCYFYEGLSGWIVPMFFFCVSLFCNSKNSDEVEDVKSGGKMSRGKKQKI